MKENKEFKSDTVTFTIERKPDCIIEYKVKTSPQIAQKARRNALRSIAKEVSLPGFRKGKAPEALIIKKFSEPLKEQWKKELGNLVFRECQNITKIPILSQDAQISFNVEKHSIEDGANLTYTFETEPDAPDIDIEKIELIEETREVIDENKINETIDQIRYYFAEWEKISNRAVQKDDYVVVDVDVIEEDPPRKALSNTRFQVNKEKMAQWMLKLVIGMKPGESKEGISIPDDDAPEAHKKETPPKKVQLILNSIENAKLPPIDNELAKKVGVSTVKEMHENLDKLLNKQADDHVQKAYREQINAYLLKHYTFDLPKSLLKKETQFRIKQLTSDPQFQSKLMSMNEEDQKKALHNIEKQGEQALLLFYLTRKVVQDQNIQISPTEVQKNINTPLEAMFTDRSDLYSAKEQSKEQQAMAMSRLMLTKAEDYLISKAIIHPPKSKKEATTTTKEQKETPQKSPKKKKSAPKKTALQKKSTPKKKTDKS